MIKIDLITGFLGAGKTTFLHKYAEYLTGKGCNTGIIENDFGAVNIDTLMLQDLPWELCEVEQIIGGNTAEDWKRRFRAKLISMAMRGFDRIIVEPSGIYDTEVFFDVLREETLEKWYEAGSIIMVMDALNTRELSEQEEYLVVSQASAAGAVLFSRYEEAGPAGIEETENYLCRLFEKFGCRKDLYKIIVNKPVSQLDFADMERLENCGWDNADYRKLWFDSHDIFSSLSFMDMDITAQRIKEAAGKLFYDESFGNVRRVKGFVKDTDGGFIEINAAADGIFMRKSEHGQKVIIVIGSQLNREKISELLEVDNE